MENGLGGFWTRDENANDIAINIIFVRNIPNEG